MLVKVEQLLLKNKSYELSWLLILWHQCSHHGWYQAINAVSLITEHEVELRSYAELASWSEPASGHDDYELLGSGP